MLRDAMGSDAVERRSVQQRAFEKKEFMPQKKSHWT